MADYLADDIVLTFSNAPYLLDDLVLTFSEPPTTTTEPETTTTTDSETTTTNTSSVTLTDLDNKRIYQRNASNEQNITVEGSYTGIPGTVEARIVNHGTNDEVVPWTTLDANPSGGNFSGIITVPQGGWYNVQVRPSANPSNTSNGSNKFAVGILVLVAGQSNADFFTHANWGSSYTPNDLTAWIRVYEDEVWQNVVGHGGVTFANRLNDVTGLPVGIISAGNGGTFLVGQWDTSSWLWYTRVISLMDNIGGYCEYVLWSQGESDANSGISQSTYQTQFAVFASNLRADVSCYQGTLPIMVGLLGRYTFGMTGTPAQWQAIRDAHYGIIANDANVFFGAQGVDLAVRPADGIHYSLIAGEGFYFYGLRFSQSVLAHLGHETYYEGPTITEFRLIDSQTIDIVIAHDGGNDYTPITGITGFEVFDDASQETITSVVRTTSNIIRLRISGNITGTPSVRYLYANNPNVSAPVFDNLVPEDNSSFSLPLQSNDNIIYNSTFSTTTTPPETTTSTSTTTTTTVQPYKLDDLVLTFSEPPTTTTPEPTTTTTPEPTTTTTPPETTTTTSEPTTTTIEPYKVDDIILTFGNTYRNKYNASPATYRNKYGEE